MVAMHADDRHYLTQVVYSRFGSLWSDSEEWSLFIPTVSLLFPFFLTLSTGWPSLVYIMACRALRRPGQVTLLYCKYRMAHATPGQAFPQHMYL